MKYSQEADVLKVYRLKQFIELIVEAATIEEVDKEQVIVKFLDGTELECEMES